MIVALRHLLGWFISVFRSREDLILENLALRQQLWVSRNTRLDGRKPIREEIRTLIFRMAAENPTWGASRVHGELIKLGFQLPQATVSRWMRRAPGTPRAAQRWLTFLRNHREAIAAMDFFTVPTLTFGVLYCFFVISHGRRKILHCNVTRDPTARRSVADPLIPDSGELFPSPDHPNQADNRENVGGDALRNGDPKF